MKERETMEEVMNQELSDAIATLNRANRALSRIFGIEERDSVGNCAACNSWDDSLESGICQTCISQEE